MFKECFDNVRKTVPLVHNITNYVTVTDVANIELACGGSPIMADDLDEVEDITSICGGLSINIGTLNKNTIPSMQLAGKKSNELNHILLLDPVGAGASKLRTETALSLIRNLKFNVVRGNISEIKALALGTSGTKGVDANIDDVITEENLEKSIAFIKSFSKKINSIVAVTGAIDLVCDGDKCFVIRNGCSEMGRITGSGCQLSGMMTAFLIANPQNCFVAAAASVCAMGLAGQIAKKHMLPSDGNSTYRNRIIDAIYNMNGEELEEGALYEIR